MKFKVGDRVRVVSDEAPGYNNGVVVIISVRSAKYEESLIYETDQEIYRESELELAPNGIERAIKRLR